MPSRRNPLDELNESETLNAFFELVASTRTPRARAEYA
jgi:hypothetical protein